MIATVFPSIRESHTVFASIRKCEADFASIRKSVWGGEMRGLR